MKYKCLVCKTEGEIVESTDLICRPCYEKLNAENKDQHDLIKILKEANEHYLDDLIKIWNFIRVESDSR